MSNWFNYNILGWYLQSYHYIACFFFYFLLVFFCMFFFNNNFSDFALHHFGFACGEGIINKMFLRMRERTHGNLATVFFKKRISDHTDSWPQELWWGYRVSRLGKSVKFSCWDTDIEISCGFIAMAVWPNDPVALCLDLDRAVARYSCGPSHIIQLRYGARSYILLS